MIPDRGRYWSWVGACSIGSAHIAAETGCDDAGACLEVPTPGGPTLIAVVSDGAGTAVHSGTGAKIACSEFCRAALEFLTQGGQLDHFDSDVADQWLDRVRDRIAHIATEKGSALRSFAATLVGAVVQHETAAFVHVGDGGCVLRLAGQSDWTVQSWPSHGEYASTTYFVTDDPQPNTKTSLVAGTIEEVALFTDGLERLALDFTSTSAFPGFFDPMFQPLRVASAGRQRELSGELRTFLDSPRVIERTDDDKTIILARRVAPAVISNHELGAPV